MRRELAPIVIVAGLTLPGAAAGQQHLPSEPPPNPAELVPEQRLKIIDQRLLMSAEKFQQAAETGGRTGVEEATKFSRETIEAAREVFGDLPQDRRAAYEQAIVEAEQALQGADARTGAEAMQTLQERVRELAARGA
jgi:polyhydroxyalkanoate synthesis regulator phasin